MLIYIMAHKSEYYKIYADKSLDEVCKIFDRWFKRYIGILILFVIIGIVIYFFLK